MKHLQIQKSSTTSSVSRVYGEPSTNERCLGSPFIDRVTVIPDSESDSDAENNDAENERAITVGAPTGSNQPHIIDV